MLKSSTALSALVAIFLLSTPVAAADVYTGNAGMKDTAPAAGSKPVNWTGLYLGAFLGGGAVVHDFSEFSKHGDGDWGKTDGADGLGGEGFLGGAQIGFDIQRGRFVFGPFADFEWSNLNTELGIGEYKQELEKDWGWTVGARAGYLVTPNTLAYVLGGYTQAGYKLSGAYTDEAGFKTSPDLQGWTVGGGLETALGDGWFLSGEYRFNQYGEATLFDNSADAYCATKQAIEPSEHTARVKLNYKLGAERIGF